MDKCPFCDYKIEPDDFTFKDIAEHVVRNHEKVSLDTFVTFLYFSESPRFFVFELWKAFDNLKTERWYNS